MYEITELRPEVEKSRRRQNIEKVITKTVSGRRSNLLKLLLNMGFWFLVEPSLAVSDHSNSTEEITTDLQSGLLLSPLQKESLQAQPQKLYYLTDALGIRAALAFDSDKLSSNRSTPLWLGLRYQLPLKNLRHLETAVDYTSAKELFISLVIKKIFYPEQRFRPFFSWGISYAPEPSGQLAGLIDLESYFLSVSGGFEDLLTEKASVRVEIELKANHRQQIGLVSLGYSWASIF